MTDQTPEPESVDDLPLHVDPPDEQPVGLDQDDAPTQVIEAVGDGTPDAPFKVTEGPVRRHHVTTAGELTEALLAESEAERERLADAAAAMLRAPFEDEYWQSQFDSDALVTAPMRREDLPTAAMLRRRGQHAAARELALASLARQAEFCHIPHTLAI